MSWTFLLTFVSFKVFQDGGRACARQGHSRRTGRPPWWKLVVAPASYNSRIYLQHESTIMVCIAVCIGRIKFKFVYLTILGFGQISDGVLVKGFVGSPAVDAFISERHTYVHAALVINNH